MATRGILTKDFHQGSLDVMVQRTGDQGQGNIIFIQNNFYYDAFFLKAIGKVASSLSAPC